MIPAKHSYWFQKVFGLYLRYIAWRDFHKIQIIGNYEDKGLPLLVIANHMSWWDGFWIMLLNRKIMKRKFHVMMLEEQLRRYSFLRMLGAFSIRKRSKTAIDTLQYAANLLKSPGNMVLIFPQGEIQSQHKYPFRFQNGWGRIFANLDQPIQILMIVNIVDYFSQRKPTLKQYLLTLEKSTGFFCPDLQDEYNRFFEDSLKQHKE
jgi:1-acyl-sn-glycerol-3-phosphate acyltransferase